MGNVMTYSGIVTKAVSYTHLDVYKRQDGYSCIVQQN